MSIRRALSLLSGGALALTLFGNAPADAAPTSINDLCKVVPFQESIGTTNHGQCVDAFSDVVAVDALCGDPDLRAVITALEGVQNNYGQCKKALATF